MQEIRAWAKLRQVGWWSKIGFPQSIQNRWGFGWACRTAWSLKALSECQHGMITHWKTTFQDMVQKTLGTKLFQKDFH